MKVFSVKPGKLYDCLDINFILMTLLQFLFPLFPVALILFGVLLCVLYIGKLVRMEGQKPIEARVQNLTRLISGGEGVAKTKPATGGGRRRSSGWSQPALANRTEPAPVSSGRDWDGVVQSSPVQRGLTKLPSLNSTRVVFENEIHTYEFQEGRVHLTRSILLIICCFMVVLGVTCFILVCYIACSRGIDRGQEDPLVHWLAYQSKSESDFSPEQVVIQERIEMPDL